MSAYAADADCLAWAFLCCMMIAAAGFILLRWAPAATVRLAAWVLAVCGVAGAERISTAQPAGFRMLAIIAAALLGMKAIVAVESRLAGLPAFSLPQWLRFTLMWPGMRPQLFTRPLGGPLAGAAGVTALGLRRLLEGAVLLLAASLIAGNVAGPHHLRFWLATPWALAGLSLVLHFGLFNLLAGFWRFRGIDCRPLFRAPLAATSLVEFWSRRWNLAFSQMAAVAVYRPVHRRAGRPAAVFASFLFSGLVHELAISLPVRAGYGLPMLYFILHGLLVLIEERTSRLLRRWPAWLGHVWTLGWLGLPLPLLFHPPFLAAVVWPLIGYRS